MEKKLGEGERQIAGSRVQALVDVGQWQRIWW